jgi:hypothetical protein
VPVVNLCSRKASDRDARRVIPAPDRKASADCAPGLPSTATTLICTATVVNATSSPVEAAEIIVPVHATKSVSAVVSGSLSEADEVLVWSRKGTQEDGERSRSAVGESSVKSSNSSASVESLEGREGCADESLRKSSRRGLG